MEYNPPGSSVHGILQARILEGVATLLQGIVPTQGLNPGLPHCRQILYHLSHQGGGRGQWLSIHPTIHSFNQRSIKHLLNAKPGGPATIRTSLHRTIILAGRQSKRPRMLE